MKFNYEVIQGLTSKHKSDALEFGELVHKGLELINSLDVKFHPGAYNELSFLAETKGNPTSNYTGLLSVLNVIATKAAKFSLSTLQQDERRSIKHLLLLLTRYAENYQNDKLRTSMVEVRHKVYLGKSPKGLNVFWSGTCDGLTADKVIEHKTSSYLDAGFVNGINPNTQACGYIMLARDYLKNPTLNTVIFDVIGTTGYGRSAGALTTRPAQWTLNKEPNKLFLRIETSRSEEALAEWKADVLRDADRMAEDIESGSFSRYAEPRNCTAYKTTCTFIDICRAPDAQRGTLIDNTLDVVYRPGTFDINAD